MHTPFLFTVATVAKRKVRVQKVQRLTRRAAHVVCKVGVDTMPACDFAKRLYMQLHRCTAACMHLFFFFSV